MSKITSIATAVPTYKHNQSTLLNYAKKAFCDNELDARKLSFLYHQSGIGYRYSILPDFDEALNNNQLFENKNTIAYTPTITKRMELFSKHAADISVNAIVECINDKITTNQITHLITVSCTGMSAPGLDLQIMEALKLPKNMVRTSVNFMGCYAAIHALKIADAFCNNDTKANVIVVCTEFCTLHFQSQPTVDNLTASLLFADGCAAVLIQHNNISKGLQIENFYSHVNFDGKKDMSWSLSENGFLMTLSGYVPELIKADFNVLVASALAKTNRTKEDVTHWCVHPGGKKIVDNIALSLAIDKANFAQSYQVLHDYGNMSSPTIIFVLQKILQIVKNNSTQNDVVFAAAFGPGLTMETFTATYA